MENYGTPGVSQIGFSLHGNDCVFEQNIHVPYFHYILHTKQELNIPVIFVVIAAEL